MEVNNVIYLRCRTRARVCTGVSPTNKKKKKKRKVCPKAASALRLSACLVLFAGFTQTHPLLRSCIVFTRSAVCHAGVLPAARSQYYQHAPVNTTGVSAAMRGCDLAARGQPPPSAGVVESEDGGLIGADDEGSAAPTVFSVLPMAPYLQCCRGKAPLPPLCIMTNQGRQAAVPLAHHSTVRRTNSRGCTAPPLRIRGINNTSNVGSPCS